MRFRWLPILVVVQPLSISARGWSQEQNSDSSRGLARRDERDNIGAGPLRPLPRSDLSLEAPLLQTTTNHAVSFGMVRRVATINVFFNALRPDPTIIWQARLPRIMWEVCIAVAAAAADGGSPPLLLLLSLMTLPTALVDIFIWAPGFALFSEFETCKGGGFFSREPRVCEVDYARGLGRLLVVAQCVVTGVLYLLASVVSFTAFVDDRETVRAKKNAAALAGVLQK
mmetsp:Transcript_4165/g.9317  ORF Transcript_4165/g.9317 Transcript_4165/m.9317 type:complete len:227 (+) Transcript_4165:223-903(+)